MMALSAGAGVLFFKSSFGSLFAPKLGIVPWALPEAANPPATLAARWISVPFASPSGVVYGVVEADGVTSVVALDGDSGAVRWKTALEKGEPLANFRHGDGWNRNDARVEVEFIPDVPVLGIAGDALMVAHDHDWAWFDAARGTLRGAGTLPASLPAVSPAGGFCALGNDAWIAMKDERAGGLKITAAGTTDGKRLDRPADCTPPAGTREEPYGFRTSPLQQVHSQQIPDGCMRVPHRAKTKKNYCEFWGLSPSGAELAVDSSTVYYGDQLFEVERTEHSTHTISLVGLEASKERLFVTASQGKVFSSETRPAADSFDPVVRTSGYRFRAVLLAVDSDGKPQWNTVIGTSDGSWGNPLVVASHPAAPAQNLYLFKPGRLVALDQRTGAARFRVSKD